MSAPPIKHTDGKKLREAALAYPQTVEDFPWGDRAMKVAGKKVFLFIGASDGGGFSCSMKLPYRHEDALKLRNTKPTPYGLGRAGWVSFTFTAKSRVPLTKMLDWLDESWRAVAPAKLSASYPGPTVPKRRKAS
ncbi:MAG: MmcQ/YjbR family DNA-binding protein [Vitreimonas sp.]